MSSNGQSMTTEKYLPFQLSRIRFAPVYGPQVEPLVVTGSSQEDVNSVCIWQYNRSPRYVEGNADHHTSNENILEGSLPSLLGDSADEPRLVATAAHQGDVQQLRAHAASRLLFTASSMGYVNVYSIGLPDLASEVFRLTEVAKWSRLAGAPDEQQHSTNVPISDIAVSADARQIYAGNDFGHLIVLDTELLTVKQQLKPVGIGYDVATVNAIESIDENCVASANQIGHLDVWDLRSSNRLHLPQRRIVPTGEPRPLVSLAQHPGQSHLLAVGGINSGGFSDGKSNSTSYIWDLRAEQHPLSEITCKGSAVWELAFHPRQPQFLYLATEECGLVRIQSASLTDSWSFAQNCQKKLSVAYVSANPSADYCSVTTFDLAASGLIVAGRDNCALQTIKDTSVSLFSCV